MNPYQIDSNYAIDRLTAVLGIASATSIPVPDGFYSAISIPEDFLRDIDVQVLSEYMKSQYYEKFGLVILLKGNNRKPIVFDSKKDSLASANQQIPNLGKQLMFSIFRKTGIKFSVGVQVEQTKGI